MTEKLAEKDIMEASRGIANIKREIKKAVVGQDRVIDAVIKAIICNGHVLLEGPTGVSKTMLVLFLSRVIKGAQFQRVQFTPDLLPSDITGVTAYEQHRGFYTLKGPVFTNILLADEINRAPPKVQSALLQAMQERQVTIGKETFALPSPFFVIATQNPLETKGVYTLPEAQVDRFIFKVHIGLPERQAEIHIMERNVDVMKLDDFGLEQSVSLEDIHRMQETVKDVKLATQLKKYIVRLINATRNPKGYNLEKGKYIQFGASPRASIYLALAAKATALMSGRGFVVPEDIRQIMHDVMRHRVMLTYEAKALEISSDTIVDEIAEKVEVE